MSLEDIITLQPNTRTNSTYHTYTFWSDTKEVIINN